MGAYITYSDLFDRTPSWEEIIASIQTLPMLKAAVTLIRMNMVLRFALQEPNRPNFGRLQQMIAEKPHLTSNLNFAVMHLHNFFQSVSAANSSRISCNRWSRRS
jgi:hypothetical protein